MDHKDHLKLAPLVRKLSEQINKPLKTQPPVNQMLRGTKGGDGEKQYYKAALRERNEQINNVRQAWTLVKSALDKHYHQVTSPEQFLARGHVYYEKSNKIPKHLKVAR